MSSDPPMTENAPADDKAPTQDGGEPQAVVPSDKKENEPEAEAKPATSEPTPAEQVPSDQATSKPIESTGDGANPVKDEPADPPAVVNPEGATPSNTQSAPAATSEAPNTTGTDVKPAEAPSQDASAPHDDETKDQGENKLLKELDDEAPKTFPQVLMEILSNDEDSDTISWLPHGRSFIIYKKKKFAAQVLPKYFKATKFTSFTRKLNRWGFTRVTRGPEMGSYYHKLFLREDPSLCLRMSSHSSSKFQEQQQLMPTPMTPGGMPFGMPGMMPGMNPMMPFGGMPGGPMPGMNPADLSQQNQIINQQLQHLQWQQFQLQQLQQQQQQHAQHGQPHHHQQPPHMGPPGYQQQGHPPHQGHPPGPHHPSHPPPHMGPPMHQHQHHPQHQHHAPPGPPPNHQGGPPPPHPGAGPPQHMSGAPPPPPSQGGGRKDQVMSI